jgi:hypothetical protein
LNELHARRTEVFLRNQRLSIHDGIVPNCFVVTWLTQLSLVEDDFGLKLRVGGVFSFFPPLASAERVEMPDGGDNQARLL